VAGLFYHDVLAALADAEVRFVIVGGVAVNLQGVPRFTSDLDVAVAIDDGSLATAARVLHGLGLRNRLPVREEELSLPEVVRGWITDRNLRAFTFVDPDDPLREVDIVLDSPVPFEEMERTADRMAAGGLTLAVASIDVLVRMKAETGRSQDASDVDALRRIKELLSGHR
jgi:predicted nucleotidyltransferase